MTEAKGICVQEEILELTKQVQDAILNDDHPAAVNLLSKLASLYGAQTKFNQALDALELAADLDTDRTRLWARRKHRLLLEAHRFAAAQADLEAMQR